MVRFGPKKYREAKIWMRDPRIWMGCFVAKNNGCELCTAESTYGIVNCHEQGCGSETIHFGSESYLEGHFGSGADPDPGR